MLARSALKEIATHRDVKYRRRAVRVRRMTIKGAFLSNERAPQTITPGCMDVDR